MRKTIVIVVAAMLASSMAFAESNQNHGAGSGRQTGQQVRSSHDEIGAGRGQPEWHQSRSKQRKGRAWKQVGPAVKPPSQKE